jgi:teichuronic acid biosynthesis glycosyltransferase TuaG
MLVSVIIPTYNSEKYINNCLDSVINQTYKQIEIIVVDDCSNDQTLNLVKKFKKKFLKLQIVDLKKIVKKSSGSGSFPRNEGIKIAKGKFIAFIDSDDYWLPTKIEKQIKAIIKNNKIMSYTNCLYEDRNILSRENFIKRRFINFSIKNLSNRLLLYNPLRLSSVLIKKEIFKDHSFSIENEIRGVEDLELWFKLSNKILFKDIFKCEEYLTVIRRHNNNLTKNYNLTVIKNIYCISKYMINNQNIKKIHFFILGIFFRFFLIFFKNYKFIILKYVRFIAFVFIFLFLLLFYSPIPDVIGDKLTIKHKIENSNNSLVIISGDGDYDKKIKSYEKTFLDAQYLIKNNYVKNIYLIGNYNLIPENQIIASLLVFANYNKENIIFSDINSISTYENIKKIASILSNNKEKNVIFVTEKYRTKRAYLIWSKFYPDINVKMYYGEYPVDKWTKIKKITYESIAMLKNYLSNWI